MAIIDIEVALEEEEQAELADSSAPPAAEAGVAYGPSYAWLLKTDLDGLSPSLLTQPAAQAQTCHQQFIRLGASGEASQSFRRLHIISSDKNARKN